MMISLFRKEADGRLRYYNIHDQQPHLIPEWVFTVSFTVGASSWGERVHRFDSAADMDKAIRDLIKRKTREGYSLLYSFGKKRGRRRPDQDFASEIEKLAH